VHVSVINISHFKCFELYNKKSIELVFMHSSNHTSDNKRGLGM
jgi:hypothetical protein